MDPFLRKNFDEQLVIDCFSKCMHIWEESNSQKNVSIKTEGI